MIAQRIVKITVLSKNKEVADYLFAQRRAATLGMHKRAHVKLIIN